MLQFASALHGLFVVEKKAPPRKKRAHHGQGLVEYALIIAFIGVVVIVSMTFLQSRISGVFTGVGNKMDNHGCAAGTTAVATSDLSAYISAHPGTLSAEYVYDGSDTYSCEYMPH